MIGKGECRSRLDFGHVAFDAIAAPLFGNVRVPIGVAGEALMVVCIGLVALSVAMRGMTRGASDIAFTKTGALHQTQRLEAHIADVVVAARRRLRPVACAAELHLRNVVEFAWIDGLPMAVGMFLRSFMATNALNSGRNPAEVPADERGVAIETESRV